VEEVVAAAAHVGYPVTVKAADPAIENKAQRGLVRFDLIDSRTVHEAYLAVAAALGDPQAPVVVQSARSGGVELVAGVVTTACSNRWSCSTSAACTATCSVTVPSGCCRSLTSTPARCGDPCPERC
jgi:hypothetical protein